MQNFLHKVVPLSGKTHRILHFHSLPKPSAPHISGSFLSRPLHPLRPWRSEHTVSVKFRGFVSGPVLTRHFMLNSSNSFLRVSSGRVGGCSSKLLRAQFHGSFDVNRSFRSHSSGWRSWFEGLTSFNLVLGLIVANVVVFLSWRIADEKFMLENFTISLHNFKHGRLHTLITSAFSHIDIEHIIYNMIGLYFFGNSIGSAFGPEYLLKLYLAGAVGGSVFYLLHQAYKAQTSKDWRGTNVSKQESLDWSGTDVSKQEVLDWRGMDVSKQEALVWRGTDASKQKTLGASGAVNAIMLLNIFLFPKSTLDLSFIIPVPAILLVILLIGRDVLKMREGDSRISRSAHFGGAAVAIIAWARVRKGRF